MRAATRLALAERRLPAHPLPQDTLPQLLTQLKASEQLLGQHHGELPGVLAELDPVAHSLGYLVLL